MRAKRRNIQLELALEPERVKPGAPEPKGPKPAWRVPNPNAQRLGPRLSRSPCSRLNPSNRQPVCTVVWEGRSREAPPYPDFRRQRYFPPPDSQSTR